MEKMTDSKKCALYIVNGIIVDWKEYTGKMPTIEQVRNNFNFPEYEQITDEEITTILRAVEQFY